MNAVKAILYLRSQMKLFLYYLHFFYQTWVQVSTTDVHTRSLNMCFAKTGIMNTTLYLQVPMYFYPYFPHLLSDMSKIKHFPFLHPTPYNDSEPPSPSYSWTLRPPDYHLEGPCGGKGWGSGATRTMCGSPTN